MSPGAAAVWPPLAWQVAYADIAWVIMAAAAALLLLPARWGGSGARAAVVVAIALAGAAVALHAVGRTTAASALGLALQQPSGWLTALALASIARRFVPGRSAGPAVAAERPPVWPWPWALVVATFGVVLALDVLGIAVFGLVPVGLATQATASWIAAVLALLALGVAIVRPRQRVPALALLAALALHAVLRLPTGNLWDALIDPLLWGVSVVTVLRAGWSAARPGRTLAHNRAS